MHILAHAASSAQSWSPSQKGEHHAQILAGGSRLLDLGFLESHVLAGNGIVLAERDLLGGRARVLLRNIEEAGAGRAQKLDLLSDGLSHVIRVRFLSRLRALYRPTSHCQAAKPSAVIRSR